MEKAIGQMYCDIHNFSEYLVKELKTPIALWNRVTMIAPDYDILEDHNKNYFINKDIDPESKIVTCGRKVSIRNKPVVLIYNNGLDEKYINPNPFSVILNRETDSVHTLLINFNAFEMMVNNRDYESIYKFFNTFYAWILGADNGDNNYVSLYAVFAYVDLLFGQLYIDVINDYFDYNLAEATDILSQVLMEKFHIKNPCDFVLELIYKEDLSKVFYYPSELEACLEAGRKDAFILKGFMALIEDTFSNQTSENKKLLNAFIDLKNNISATEDYTKDTFKSILEFEPRLEKQIDLLLDMDSSYTAIKLIHMEINKFIDKYGIDESIKEEDVNDNDKLVLDESLETKIKEVIKNHRGEVGI